MFIKSIRGRLQIWYGLMLLLVLAGFGFTAFQLERGRVFRLLDDELQRRAAMVRDALRPARPPGHRPGEPQPDRLPLEPPLPGPERLPEPPGPGVPGPMPVSPPAPHFPAWMTGLFDNNDTNGFYCAIFARDGTELAHFGNLPSPFPRVVFPVVGPGYRQGGEPLPRPLPEPARTQTRAQYREVSFGVPPGHTVVVGRSMAPEMAELRRFAWGLTVVGAGVLLLGLTGGWWLASSALRPIDQISAAALKISVGDLSHRINAADTDSELGRLATVLNSTFARLETAFGQQKQFTSDAAHELRTPVAVILTQTQATLTRERSAGDYRDTIETCQRSAQRMRRLIESLLELARLDAGQEPLRRTRCDLSRVIQDCVAFVGPLAAGRSVNIHTDLRPVDCMGDPERLSQVLDNLLTNAIEYNKQGGEVRVSLRSETGSAMIVVSDTGQGIAATDLPHIFKRFFRADTARATGHSGLGLAIAKAIVEAHGGTIEAASQPGQGTTFSLRLPS